jgi:hypothetical protein
MRLFEKEKQTMSWSVSGVGKPKALAAKLAGEFERMNGNCSEPEESMKNAAAVQIAAGLGAYPDGYLVKVEANGTQYAPDSKAPDEKVNSLTVKIENWGLIVE